MAGEGYSLSRGTDPADLASVKAVKLVEYKDLFVNPVKPSATRRYMENLAWAARKVQRMACDVVAMSHVGKSCVTFTS